LPGWKFAFQDVHVLKAQCVDGPFQECDLARIPLDQSDFEVVAHNFHGEDRKTGAAADIHEGYFSFTWHRQVRQ